MSDASAAKSKTIARSFSKDILCSLKTNDVNDIEFFLDRLKAWTCNKWSEILLSYDQMLIILSPPPVHSHPAFDWPWREISNFRNRV